MLKILISPCSLKSKCSNTVTSRGWESETAHSEPAMQPAWIYCTIWMQYEEERQTEPPSPAWVSLGWTAECSLHCVLWGAAVAIGDTLQSEMKAKPQQCSSCKGQPEGELHRQIQEVWDLWFCQAILTGPGCSCETTEHSGPRQVSTRTSSLV